LSVSACPFRGLDAQNAVRVIDAICANFIELSVNNIQMRTLLSIAEAHLERSYSPGKGHRFTLDPHEQESASGSAIIRAHHEYLGIPVITDDIPVHINTSGDAKTPAESIDFTWECGSVPNLSADDAAAACIEHFRSAPRKADPQRPCRVPHRSLLARRKLKASAVASFPMPARPTVFSVGNRKPLTMHLAIIADGPPKLVWLVRLPIRTGIEYLVAVNATSGSIAFCAPWSASVRCSALAYRNNPDEGARTRVDFPQPLASYPPGLQSHPSASLLADWMDDATMIGNCTEMFSGNSAVLLTAAAAAGGLQFAPNDPTGHEQSLVNAFFLCNYLHDFFLMLGFGEKEGNFQFKNVTTGGRAGDRLRIFVFDNAMDISGSMVARDDGIPGELVLSRAKSSKHSAALDADVVMHEFAHGVSHRLVGGRLGFHALIEEQSIAIDEGWSDYFAMTIQNASRQTPVNIFGTYTSGNASGMRLAPYDANYPATYGKLGKGKYKTPIAAAEIWAVALIEMNRLIGTAVGTAMRGHEIGWRAVIESMKLVPKNPNFVQGRQSTLDGIDALRANGFLSAAEHSGSAGAVREAFRLRGLGSQASSNGPQLSDAREDFT
jgi:extracellular elastinolytic metalloproteinase